MPSLFLVLCAGLITDLIPSYYAAEITFVTFRMVVWIHFDWEIHTEIVYSFKKKKVFWPPSPIRQFSSPPLSANYPLATSAAHESRLRRQKQSGWVGQWRRAKLSRVFVCRADNKGPTWPSPPSSSCVVASTGPWSSSWKSRAGSLPPLQVRWEEVIIHGCFLWGRKCINTYPICCSRIKELEVKWAWGASGPWHPRVWLIYFFLMFQSSCFFWTHVPGRTG